MKIKIFFAPFLQDYAPVVPTSIASVTAYLKQKGFYIKQDDLAVQCYNKLKEKEEFKKINLMSLSTKHANKIVSSLKRTLIPSYYKYTINKILSLSPYEDFDIIGFSIYSLAQLYSSLLMAKEIKKRTNSIIVFGGPYLKHTFKEVLPDFSFIDYVVYDEGEIAFEKLLGFLEGKIKLESVPGIAYMKNKKIIINSINHLKIDDVPPPDFHDLKLSEYPQPLKIPVQLSKGCLSNCAYCTFKHDSPVFKEKEMDRIIENLIFLKNTYKTNKFDFMPSNALNNTRPFVIKLCKRIIKEKMDLEWFAYMKPVPLDEEMIKLMKQAGCSFIFFGVESINKERLISVKKNVNLPLLQKMLKLSKKLNIRTRIAFIYGFPYETKEEFLENLEFIKNNSIYIDEINYNKFRLEKNSHIFLNPKKYKIKIGKPIFPYSTEYTFDETERFNHKERIAFIKENVENNEISRRIIPKKI